MGVQSLGTFLLNRGKLSRDAFDRAERVHRETGEPLEAVLTKLGLVSEPVLADGYADLLGLDRLTAADLPDEPVEIDDLNPSFLRLHRLLPLAFQDDALVLVMANPTDAFARRAMAFATQRPIRVAVATVTDVEEAVERLYFAGPSAASATDDEAGTFSMLDDDTAVQDVARLKELASDAPVIKLVNRLLVQAFEAGASDIHFEPNDGGLRVRFRIDGHLCDVEAPPPAMRAAIVSRLKIMAHLDISERRMPQDGRFRTTVHGADIDLRVATSPTAFGESVVLRILDRRQLPQDFAALGFAEAAVAPFKRAIARPEGIVLVTGPTGSGKTTTLYAALRQLNAPDRKILTVEDPVEYMLGGINQAHVDPRIGRTFAAMLRSFLRQDPDIIMVGEIRDKETAEIAVQAALTGHLVLSTLHTNSAASAVTRLLDMGVQDYLIASTVTAVAAQRLVRVLCGDCRQAYRADGALADQVRAIIPDAPARPRLYRAAGCDACGHTGYRGRTGIIEVLEVTDAIRTLVQTKADAADIERGAVAEGMRTMYRNGLERVLAGETTIEEVMRVTRDI